jgi:uncharacterized protein (DUF2147 family)
MEVKPKRIVCAFLLAVMCLASPAVVLGGDAEGIVGVWNTSENDARIEIYKCDTGYCGKIAYLQDPNYPADDKEGMAGLPLMDRYNPNPALRKRPLVGLRLIEGFRFLGRNTWDGGRIYNPENGKYYKATISLADSNRLMLRGYWGISLLGRTETWVRCSNEHNSGA